MSQDPGSTDINVKGDVSGVIIVGHHNEVDHPQPAAPAPSSAPETTHLQAGHASGEHARVYQVEGGNMYVYPTPRPGAEPSA